MTLNVPQVILNDRNGRAMAAAVNAAAEYFLEKVQSGLSELMDVDAMSESRLDDLAWEYDLPWYDYTADVETKRRTIKNMRSTLMAMGTPKAVADVISAMLGSKARLSEWREYGAEAYHFRVVSSTTILPQTEREKLYSAIAAIQNVRSVMDEILWAYGGDGVLFTGGKAEIYFRGVGK